MHVPLSDCVSLHSHRVHCMHSHRVYCMHSHRVYCMHSFYLWVHTFASTGVRSYYSPCVCVSACALCMSVWIHALVIVLVSVSVSVCMHACAYPCPCNNIYNCSWLNTSNNRYIQLSYVKIMVRCCVCVSVWVFSCTISVCTYIENAFVFISIRR